MNPLTVTYSDTAPEESAPGTVIMDRQSLCKEIGYLWDLQDSINKGDIDFIIIVGRSMCAGWVLFTTRFIKFIPPTGLQSDLVAHLSTRVRPGG